jgi:hypothetical protein
MVFSGADVTHDAEVSRNMVRLMAEASVCRAYKDSLAGLPTASQARKLSAVKSLLSSAFRSVNRR